MSRHLVVTIETPYCAYVRGHGSRELLMELKGRPPVWATRSRAWCVQERTARDVLALAEARGFTVELVDEGSLTPSDLVDLDEETAQPLQGVLPW